MLCILSTHAYLWPLRGHEDNLRGDTVAARVVGGGGDDPFSSNHHVLLSPYSRDDERGSHVAELGSEGNLEEGGVACFALLAFLLRIEYVLQ